MTFDRLIVSGDLESMLRDHDWLFRRFDVGQSQSTGLNLPADRVILLPGNHDAYNSVHASPSMAGSAAKKIIAQKSRLFNVPTIRNDPDQYTLRIDGRVRNERIHDFDEPHVKLKMDFPHSRVMRY